MSFLHAKTRIQHDLRAIIQTGERLGDALFVFEVLLVIGYLLAAAIAAPCAVALLAYDRFMRAARVARTR